MKSRIDDDRLRARDEALRASRRHDQVDVALAIRISWSARPWNLSGSGRSDLVSRRSFVTLHRQLAGLGLEQRAFGADDVAQVPVLERVVRFLADVVVRDVELDAARCTSCSVAKLALPITRLSIMRPATAT